MPAASDHHPCRFLRPSSGRRVRCRGHRRRIRRRASARADTPWFTRTPMPRVVVEIVVACEPDQGRSVPGSSGEGPVRVPAGFPRGGGRRRPGEQAGCPVARHSKSTTESRPHHQGGSSDAAAPRCPVGKGSLIGRRESVSLRRETGMRGVTTQSCGEQRAAAPGRE